MSYESELEFELTQVLDRLRKEVGYEKSDNEVFGNNHTLLGSVSGFWLILHGGAVCISHPKWPMKDAERLSGFLSTRSFKNRLNEQCYCHFSEL